MDIAILVNNVHLKDGSITIAGTEINAMRANYMYHNKEGGRALEYKCPICKIPLSCAKEATNLEKMQLNEKNPYFRKKKLDEGHLDYCLYNLQYPLTSKKKSIQIERQHNYYSKLIEPRSLTGISSNKVNNSEITELTGNIRKDTNSTSQISCIADVYLSALHKNNGYTPQFYKNLDNLVLHLPSQGAKTYRGAILKANVRIKMQKPRIYFDYLSFTYRFADYILFVFRPPFDLNTNPEKHQNWKPVFAIINIEKFKAININQVNWLNNSFFLNYHQYFFVYGSKVENNRCYIINVAHCNWIAFKKNPLAKSKSEVKYVDSSADKMEARIVEIICFMNAKKKSKLKEKNSSVPKPFVDTGEERASGISTIAANSTRKIINCTKHIPAITYPKPENCRDPIGQSETNTEKTTNHKTTIIKSTEHKPPRISGSLKSLVLKLFKITSKFKK